MKKPPGKSLSIHDTASAESIAAVLADIYQHRAQMGADKHTIVLCGTCAACSCGILWDAMNWRKEA